MLGELVVGGGPAGAALAWHLAAAGREVVVCEREAAPAHKVCGEFISWEAAASLSALGIDVAALGGVPIDSLRLYCGRRGGEFELPCRAQSLSRRALDEALLQGAAAAGARVRRGAKVSSLSRRRHAWSARLAGGDELAAATAFLATGKHDLREPRRPRGTQNDLVAFKVHFRLAPEAARALEAHVELTLFDGGYAGLQPIEAGDANLCLVIRRHRLQALGHRWPNVLTALRSECPQLAARLRGSAACWSRPLAVSTIPYGYVCRRADGLFRLGDQAAVIPSFAGDGIAMALHSAELASATYLAGASPEDYQRRLAGEVQGQVWLATALSHALVRPGPQRGLAAAARLWPALVSAVARQTRVSDAALARARRV